MKGIDGSTQNLRDLLFYKQYTIHYYQREYMWERKHVEELIDDLTSEFLEYYDESHDIKDIKYYGAYFMGSVVMTGLENAIIDGQQRFTTFTLLLIYLNNRIKSINESDPLIPLIEGMIYTRVNNTFNIDVEDREDCMDALFNGKPFDTENVKESVKNLYDRYYDIQEIFPESRITEEMLLLFCQWLVDKVLFIRIDALTDQDAHKIFVTMNDRGLSLTPTEMLKGYILSEIEDDDKREKFNDEWKEKVLELKKDDKNGDDAFIKAWLRAQYAETIREGKKGAENKDWDKIGSSFHKWVRDEREKIGLNNSGDFELFMKKFMHFADFYIKIKKAENRFIKNQEYVYYNGKVEFTFQSQLLLAPLCYEDDWNTAREKINLVARFIDIYILSRFSNHKQLGYDYIKNYVFRITKDIRQCSISELKDKLNAHYIDLEYNPEEAIPNLKLRNNKRYIKHMLARITSFIEEEVVGIGSDYDRYMDTKLKDPFEIEHIISDHFDWFDEYNDMDDFKNYRNSIGALLLLNKSINASLNDSPYEKKIVKYSNSGTTYSRSLGKEVYMNNPRFKKFMKKYDLSFKPYDTFGKQEINERNQLVIQLVKLIWNNDMFIN